MLVRTAVYPNNLRADVPLTQQRTYLLAGQPRAAELAFREAAADASHQARPEPLLGLARALSAQGQMSQALETLAEARRAARTPAEEIAVLLGRAQIYRLAGASARAARAARIARRRAEAAGLEEVTARSHLLLAAASKSPARAGRHLGAGVQRIEIWNADSRDLAMEAVRAIARPGRGTLPET